MHFVELLSFFTCKNQVNWYITNDFVNSTPPDSLKKYVTPQVINIVYKWSTVVFFLVLHKIIPNLMWYTTQSKVFHEQTSNTQRYWVLHTI